MNGKTLGVMALLWLAICAPAGAGNAPQSAPAASGTTATTAATTAETTAETKADLAAGVQATWDRLIDALRRGDKAAALACLADPQKYDAAFTAMGNKMPVLAASLSALRLVELTPQIATGVVDQTKADGKVSQHHVTFIHPDGRWLIVDF